MVVLVGQMGQDIGCYDCSAGGGGGTFVAYSDSPFNGQPYNSFDLQPLIVAGGGGGAGDDSHGSDAVITEEALCYTCPEPGHGGYSYYGNNGGGGYLSSGNGIVEAVGFGFLQGGRGGQSNNSWGGSVEVLAEVTSGVLQAVVTQEDTPATMSVIQGIIRLVAVRLSTQG